MSKCSYKDPPKEWGKKALQGNRNLLFLSVVMPGVEITLFVWHVSDKKKLGLEKGVEKVFFGTQKVGPIGP